MKRYKKPKQGKIEISVKELKKIKYDVTKEATQKAVLLVLAAAQEVKNFDEDDVCEVFETVSRWVGFMDDNLIKPKDVQNATDEKRGAKIHGWAYEVM